MNWSCPRCQSKDHDWVPVLSQRIGRCKKCGWFNPNQIINDAKDVYDD